MDDEEGCFHHASHSKGCHLRLKSGEVVESSLVYMKCIRIRTRVSGSDGLKSYLFLNLRLHLILPPLLQLVLKKNYQTFPLLCPNFFSLFFYLILDVCQAATQTVQLVITITATLLLPLLVIRDPKYASGTSKFTSD